MSKTNNVLIRLSFQLKDFFYYVAVPKCHINEYPDLHIFTLYLKVPVPDAVAKWSAIL